MRYENNLGVSNVAKVRLATGDSENLPSDFDAAEYIKLNPDVALSELDPATHYLLQGIKEGRRYQRPSRGALMDRGMLTSLEAETACFGRADPITSAMVTGWIVDPDRGYAMAFIDGEPAGQAAVAPPGCPPSGAPVRARLFSYAIPQAFQDGRSHFLSILLADGTAVAFPTHSRVSRANVRFRFEHTAPGEGGVGTEAAQSDAAPTGCVGLADPFSNTTITGWAIDRRSPGEPVRLRAFIDGQAAGSVVCDRPRRELKEIGLPWESGGFSFEIPERHLDGFTHTLSMLFDDDSVLRFQSANGNTRSKLEFTAEPVTSTDGVVDGLYGDTVKGWAFRRHHRTGDIEGYLRIQVLCNGVALEEITADRPRMDVAREYRCDPRVGFEFPLPPHCRNGLEFEFVFKVLPEGDEIGGSPLAVRHRQPDAADEMHALADTVGELCAKAFKLQQQIRELMPVADGTVQNYDAWARRYLARLRARMAAAGPLPSDAPLVSVVMPTYRSNLAHLAAAIESVRKQTYGNWELIVVDDGSRQRALSACLRSYAAEDPRITIVLNRRNRGISTATNDALRRARGAFVVLFDHDDLLVEVALDALVREALRTEAKVIYSDEDKIDTFGVLSEPALKPNWNYRLLLGINYVCHLLMVERALLERVGLLRPECDGAQDHDLLLRISEHCPPEQIAHLPEILYHWRISESSTAGSGRAKPYAVEAGRRAVAQHLTRRGFANARVEPLGESTCYSVAWGLEAQPSVTVIVPFKDEIPATRRCVESLLSNTRWRDWRVVLVDNGSVTPEAAEFCSEISADPHVVMRRIEEPFNYSRLNNIAARENPADYYVFLNNDVFLEQRDWLRVMMDEALADPCVAIVGAKLLYPNATVQHAGVVLGVAGVADHVFRGIPADNPGYLNRAQLAQRYSAVTAACMLCRADVFMDVGGFDEQELVIAFNDVDLCLKAGSRGWQVVWTPQLAAEHHESLSRGDDISGRKAQRFFYENYVMLERWQGVIAADPFYSPHFSRDRGLFMDLA